MMKTITYLCAGFLFLHGPTASADEILLKNGDVLNGTVVQEGEKTLIVDHGSLGRLEIPRDQIVSRKTVSPQPEEKPQPETETYYFVKNEPEFHKLNTWARKMKEDGWKMALSFSVQADSGEDNEQRYRAGLQASRRTTARRFQTDWAYYYKVKNDSSTDNKLSSGLRYDWLKPDSPWFYFLSGRYDFDKFESWEHRVSVHAGPGYRLIDSDLMKWDVAFGGGVRKEWQSDNDKLLAEGVSTTDFSWKLSERQSVSLSSAFYPVFDDWDDYRTRTVADWRFLLSREMKLSFSIGLRHEYQSVIDPGEDHNDTRLYSGIRFDF